MITTEQMQDVIDKCAAENLPAIELARAIEQLINQDSQACITEQGKIIASQAGTIADLSDMILELRSQRDAKQRHEMDKLDFEIDDSCHRIISFKSGGCRPANQSEIDMWDMLRSKSDTAPTIQPQPASQVQEDIKTLQCEADVAYCNYIKMLSQSLCLGHEIKLMRGEFAQKHLDAFMKAYTELGVHLGLHKAINFMKSNTPVGKEADK